VIFACAPHANQFVDPIVVQRCAKREVSYLIAAASLRRPMVGRVARALNAIGVERPQDIASTGEGTLKSRTEGGRFLVLPEAVPARGHSGDAKQAQIAGVIKTVLSATELELKKGVNNEDNREEDVEMADHAYKVLPHIDQAKMFAAVSDSRTGHDR
jgi:glycerol-3-phosphate O-acyltransferase / dihydroxyacetone phosphate acyltransferase